MDRKKTAVDLKRSGCNCAQAVLMAYADKLGMNTDEIMAAGSAFGAGMGCMKATCGALIGAGIVLGKLSYGKGPVPSKARKLLCSFEEKCGATICEDLKGIKTGKVLCPCDQCVANAVEILEQITGE